MLEKSLTPPNIVREAILRQRLGHISKQGNALLRFLLVEAAQVTVRSQPEWRSKFFHLALRRGRKIAKIVLSVLPVQAAAHCPYNGLYIGVLL
ncbi:MAG TPA: transposase [Terriglobales bacterium]|nr:transposase [Terriglobales bacterium]